MFSIQVRDDGSPNAVLKSVLPEAPFIVYLFHDIHLVFIVSGDVCPSSHVVSSEGTGGGFSLCSPCAGERTVAPSDVPGVIGHGGHRRDSSGSL